MDQNNSDEDMCALVINNSGNVGIGVSALEAWHADYTALQLGGNASIIGKTTDQVSTPLNILQNAYYSDAWKKIRSDQSSRYSQLDGSHTFFVNNVTGSADDTITWVTAMTIAATGSVGIGIAAPQSDNSSTTFAHIYGSASAGLVIEDAENQW